MTQPFAVTRRNFIRMGGALPVAAAVMPTLGRSALAATGAGLPDSGMIDLPAKIAILNGNEYPSGPTPAAIAAMHQMSANGNRYYMSETAKFTAELAAYHDLKPENVTLYAGSSEPLRFTTMAFTSPTRSLVTATPTFESAWRAAAAMGAPVHKFPLKADYSYDMKAMVAADPHAGLFYVCNPNNPSGTLVKRADIEWLLENKPAGSVVLVDEAYIHFSDADSVIDLVGKGKDLVVIRTFSKIYSMGGLRFGYAMGRPDLMAKLHYFGVNSMATTAIQCAKVQLNDSQLVPLRKQAIAETRNQTYEFLAKNGYTFSPGQANHFLLDMKRPGASVAVAMAHRDVLIGRSWEICPTFSRITIGSPEQMQCFQTALLEVQEVPTDKLNSLAHPYPHLVNAHSC